MASITIRDVPDATHKELLSRAALSGQSLQEYLRSRLVDMARRPDPTTLTARIQRRKRRMPSLLPAERILEYRNQDRR